MGISSCSSTLRKAWSHVTVDIVSLKDRFDPDAYDIRLFGGGQDYEQTIVSEDLPDKKEDLERFIHDDGVVLAICGGFQLLGQYYIEASGKRIEGLGIMGHYTLNQVNNRYIGDIKIHNEEFNETYYGFENHQGRTFLAEDEKPLGKVVYGNGNNKRRWVRRGSLQETSLAATSTVLSCPEMPIWPID